MNFKIYEKESKIYDLLQFPRIYHVAYSKDSYEELSDKDMVEKLNSKSYLSMIKELGRKLAPYKEQIEKFYVNEFLSNYDYFILLTDQFSFFGYETFDEYVNNIMTKTDEELKKAFIQALVNSDNEHSPKSEAVKQTVEKLYNSPSELMHFVKELQTESNYKWNILEMLENPGKTLKSFYTLLKQLEPIYNSAYEDAVDNIKTCNKKLLEIFSGGNLEKFKSLTKNMISYDKFKNDNKLLISFLFAYTYDDRVVDYDNFFVWGIKMDEGFENLNKLYEDRIERTTKVFKILGDKTRYEALKLIAGGVTSTKEIAKKLGVTSATISYHINSFITNKVITTSESQGQKYDVNFEVLNDLWNNFLNDLKH